VFHPRRSLTGTSTPTGGDVPKGGKVVGNKNANGLLAPALLFC